MNPSDLLKNNRYCANHFNRLDYPMLFGNIKNEIENYLKERFAESSAEDAAAEMKKDIGSILDEVESNMAEQKFKFRKKSVFTDDHIVLSLFIAPAAAYLENPLGVQFANMLSEEFTKRFPGTTFKVGNYDEIIEGFKWKITLFSSK